MSIIEKLTEGIVNRDMKAEGAALQNKWAATGLLEGLETQHQKATMSRLLENQAKELLRESSSMHSGANVDGFAAVAFPIVRRVFAGLIANDLVSVQPMSLPSGLIFFLDFVYSSEINETTQTGRFAKLAEKSIYGTDKVGSEVINGVNLRGDFGENVSGSFRGQVGDAYGSPTTELRPGNANSKLHIKNAFAVSSATEAEKKAILFDPDVLAETDNYVIQLSIDASEFTNADFENLAAFEMSGSQLDDALSTSHSAANTKQIRRLTQVSGSGATKGVSFTFVSSVNITAATLAAAAIEINHPTKDSVAAGGSAPAGAIDTYTMLLENTGDIPEIDIKVDSTAITAQSKKLKAKWTPELGQDLNAYHNIDAEVELTSILSEQIALEIDREILADLVNGATAATYYWSRSPGLFVNKVTGAELGAASAAPDFTGTVSEWYETLIETINDVSAQIHLKTLRGGANYVVCSPEVANILEFTSGFRANVTADADKGDIGAVKAGSLSRKFDVIVDPYFPRNVVLVGRKGGSFLESGYVYAPYVPLQTTPTIFGPEDFVPRKGVMTRYAKKMVRPDMYGLVIVRGLVGEEYSS